MVDVIKDASMAVETMLLCIERERKLKNYDPVNNYVREQAVGCNRCKIVKAIR